MLKLLAHFSCLGVSLFKYKIPVLLRVYSWLIIRRISLRVKANDSWRNWRYLIHREKGICDMMKLRRFQRDVENKFVFAILAYTVSDYKRVRVEHIKRVDYRSPSRLKIWWTWLSVVWKRGKKECRIFSIKRYRYIKHSAGPCEKWNIQIFFSVCIVYIYMYVRL